MKKLIPILALLIITTACDSPRATRAIVTSQQSAAVSGNALGTSLNISSNTSTTTTSSNVPDDAKSCKFSTDGINGFESTSAHLGAYTLCKSSTDANVFYVQIKTPPVASTGDVNVCFIPHTTTGSNSIYVGNPMCGAFSNPKEVKKITFVKYSEFTNASINSVLFFKDTKYYYPGFSEATTETLTAYKVCMGQLALGNANYCNSFKSENHYILKIF